MMTRDRFELNYLAVVGGCFAESGILRFATVVLIGAVLKREIDHLHVNTTAYFDISAKSGDLVLISIQSRERVPFRLIRA